MFVKNKKSSLAQLRVNLASLGSLISQVCPQGCRYLKTHDSSGDRLLLEKFGREARGKRDFVKLVCGLYE